jgi:hypothetical protein
MSTQPLEVTQSTLEELTELLEPIIRRVVREELEDFAVREPRVFYLEPGSPLYEDMKELRQRAEQDELGFHSYKDVFGE